MRIKDRPTILRFIRSAKALNGTYTLIMQLHMAGADLRKYPGADRWILAGVYPYDGKAVVIPSSLRCGILVCDWSKLMRYLRRHKRS